MIEVLKFTFIQHALLAAVLASIACGVIGSYVVVKRITFISGGIAHTSFGGLGLGYFLGINPLWGVLPFSIGAALAIGSMSRRLRLAEDSLIGVFWAMGMALGVVLIELTPGYAPNLFSYLFGNILTVSAADLWLMAGLDAVILAVIGYYDKEFLALCFDEEYAEAAGVPTGCLYMVLLVLIAMTVVVLVRVVGIILVIALLTIPAATAKLLTVRFNRMRVLAVGLNLFCSLGGLALSYVFDLPSGATIILFAGIVFLATAGGQRWTSRGCHRPRVVPPAHRH